MIVIKRTFVAVAERRAIETRGSARCTPEVTIAEALRPYGRVAGPVPGSPRHGFQMVLVWVANAAWYPAGTLGPIICGSGLPMPFATACIGAVPHLVPDLAPLLSPGERALADGAGLGRQVSLGDALLLHNRPSRIAVR
jgi:hypothetical protein